MKVRRAHLFFALVVSLATLFTLNPSLRSLAAGSNWPQWRGPESTGISPEKNLPLAWSSTKNVQWKTPIVGRGHSSPIVWGNRVFLTTAVEGEIVPGAKAVTHLIEGKPWVHPDSVGANRKHAFKVIALDSNTGKVLWERTAWEGTPYDDRHRKSSYAASTSVTDGKLVYAYFGSEGLYAYDFNGKLAWKADLGKWGNQGMGTGTSPVLYQDLIIIQADEENGDNSFITALDKKTGKQVWKTPRKIQASFSTPIVVKTAKRAELITTGTEAIIAYDPLTGKELWRSKGLESNAIPSPVATSDTVIVAAGYPAKIAMAIPLGGAGEVAEKNLLWTFTKGTAYVPSPILYGDYVYLITDRGIMTALEAKTGKVMYEGGRVPIPATFTGSPVAFDGKLLLTSEDGDTFIIKAGPKHEVIGTNSIDEPVYSSPAIADGKIFIRGEKNLYCIGKS